MHCTDLHAGFMNSLSIDKFNLLTKSEKADIMHSFGVYLMDYQNGYFIYALYSLSDFYVEMIYKRRKTTSLLAIRTFKYCNDIMRYVKRIDISDLGLE